MALWFLCAAMLMAAVDLSAAEEEREMWMMEWLARATLIETIKLRAHMPF